MKIACDHCGLEFDRARMIKDNDKFFCCNGCLGVYKLLKNENLEGFYQKKGDVLLEPVKIYDDDALRFDEPLFQEQFVKQKGALKEVSLIIEGIHCAACVWLNEKVLEKESGVVELNINFTTHKARLVFDEQKIKLSKIVEIIRSIGYNAYPYDPRKNEERSYKERKEYYNKMIVAIFAAMNIMWLAIARYLGYFSGMDSDMKLNIHIAEFFLATLTVFYSGQIFFKGAFFGLKNFIVNMDLLVIVGALVTYFFSIWSAFVVFDEAYFDSATMIIAFILVGKFLEVRSKKIGIDTLDTLSATMPNQVTKVDANKRLVLNVGEIKIGDIIETKMGEKFVFDSEVIFGQSSVNTASITGESMPKDVEIGSKILGGYENIGSLVHSRVLKLAQNSTMSSIVSLLEDSMGKRSKIEQKTNAISKWFSFAILLVAFATFFGWYFYTDLQTAIIVAVSVVVIACPCALALATPIANIMGISIASKHKILFKDPNNIETLAKANVIVLDKTGTITKGKPFVVKNQVLKKFDTQVLSSLVAGSKHPISKGMLEFFPCEDLLNLNVKEESALGLWCEHEGVKYYGGNLKFISSHLKDVSLNLDENYSHFIFANQDEILGVFYLEDEIKENTKSAIKALKKMGLRVILASGDKKETTQKVAKFAQIDEVYSELMPTDKLDIIKVLQEQGNIVVSTGDGINDSLMLSKSDIAIAMHTGADTAISVSDIVLLDSSLNALANSLLISKKTYRLIKQNLALSLIYNAITIPIAIMGFVIPLIAAISMSLSSLIVVANSLRLKKIK